MRLLLLIALPMLASTAACGGERDTQIDPCTGIATAELMAVDLENSTEARLTATTRRLRRAQWYMEHPDLDRPAACRQARAAMLAEDTAARVQTSPATVTQPATTVSLSRQQRGRVCRAAIAAIMGRDVATIRVDRSTSEETQVSYVRPSDGTRWRNRCRIDGDRVAWASADPGSSGRWRDEETIRFAITGDAVTIQQRFGDGSGSTDRLVVP